MLINYNKKIEVVFSIQDELILDGQSRICNWLYNQGLTLCINDYKENNSANHFLSGDNLRNHITQKMKKEHPFLNTVFSSPIKDVSSRLVDAYERFFNGQNGYPKYRSWKKKWFSLYFDEPNKGWEVNGNQLLVMLGKIPGMPKPKKKHNPGVYGTLKETLTLEKDEKIKNFRLCKQQGNKFYAIFNIERGGNKHKEHKQALKKYKQEKKIYNFLKKAAKTKEEKKALPKEPVKPAIDHPLPENPSWITLDPNHKNFFVAVDYLGNSYEWKKLDLIKYWDKKIDHLKSMRDVCEKNYRKKKTKHGNNYTVRSPRWNKLNKALNKAYHCRREQIKTMLFTTANELYHYDVVLIGNYTPTNGTAPFDNMKRSMLNQEVIGSFRDILKWVAIKKEKHYCVVNEHNTTKKCCACGHLEKKEPSIRSFTCTNCGRTFMRDNNSAVNIGEKEGFFLEEKFFHKLEHFLFRGEVPIGKRAMFTLR